MNLLARLFKKKRQVENRTAPGRLALEDSDPEIWNNPLVKQCYLQLELGERAIETDILDEVVATKLMDRIIKQWIDLSAKPYWSNAPSPAFKLDNLSDASLRDFYDHGAGYMNVISAFESRSRVKIQDGVCLELGAGVGKHTHPLALRFDRVIAVDVAERLLTVSQERLKAAGVTNVEMAVLRKPQDLSNFGCLDFFMAQSVLQHNPPPIQKIMLTYAFANIKVGGFALFEAPDWLPGYAFSSESFLANSADNAIDCHCFPKTDIIRLLKSSGMELLDFAPDFNTECFGSYTYFARKISDGNVC